jgi:hypothetical protein
MRLRGVLAAAALIAAAVSPAWATGEHERRLAAVLVVLEGDARRLAGPVLGERERSAVSARLHGGLAVLGLLFRQAGLAPPVTPVALRELLDAGQPQVLATRLGQLTERYPLDLGILHPVTPTAARRQLAQRLHQTYCAGCHDRPDPGSAMPLYILQEMAAAMPVREFAARLLISVRGDHLTSLANPFSDDQLALLLAHYRGWRD